MAKHTKTLVALTGAALLVGAGVVGAKAYSGHGGGWQRGSGMHGEGRGHGGGHGWFGRKGGGRGGELTEEEFNAQSRARFASIDANSDGVLAVDEIKAMLESRKGGRKGRRGEGRGEGRGDGPRQGQMMRRGDADNDGKVTKEEFDAQVQRRFARADLDRDGAITDADLPPMMRGQDVLSGKGGKMGGKMGGRMGGRQGGGRSMPMLGMLVQANTDGDGSITQAEATAAADAMFARMDRNGDGALDPADRDVMQQDMLDYRVKRFIHRHGGDFEAGITKEQFDTAAKERFALRDLDDDGDLSGSELGRGHRGGDRMGRHDGDRRWHRGDDNDDMPRRRWRDRSGSDSGDDNG